MDDDSCVLNYIEILPLDDYRNCSDSSDAEGSPSRVKVCIHCVLYLSIDVSFDCICSASFVSYTILKVTENILVFSSYLHNILY